MLRFRQILVSLSARSFGLAASRVGVALLAAGSTAGALSGCGQTGPLYLPTEPAAAQRATLPQIVLPGMRPTPTSPTQPTAPTPTPTAPTSPTRP